MYNLAIALAGANLAFVLWRALHALAKHRVITLVWLLVCYWSFFLLLQAIDGPFERYRGFIGDIVTIRQETITTVCGFVLAFHLLFAVSETLVWRLLGGPRQAVQWTLDETIGWMKGATWIFAGFLLLGTVLYWLKMKGGGYREYVEFQGSNWPIVFLWASAPLATLAAFRKKYFLAIVSSVPFLFFAWLLQVRSFALLTAVPVAFIFVYQSITGPKRGSLWRKVAVSTVVFAILLAISVVSTFKKVGGLTGLPDAGMTHGVSIVFTTIHELGGYTGFETLAKYVWNIFNPFLKLLQVQQPVFIDNPVRIAGLIDGVPITKTVFFHYPALWYSDAYVSFGMWGLTLALVWGALLSLWERLMCRTPVLIALLLPFYVWHAYMLVRGATAIATVPFSYSAYMVAIVVLLLAPRALASAVGPAQPVAMRPTSLMK